MGHFFSGREFAAQKEFELSKKVTELKYRGVIPKLVSIIVGDNPASVLYVNLKKKAAERIGSVLEIRSENKEITKEEIIKMIKSLNVDSSVHGIMVQLPLPKNFSRKDRTEIINSIAPEKDVDGLIKNPKYIPATAKAVLGIIEEVEDFTNFRDYPIRFLVVGGSGFIGRQIVSAIKNLNKNSYKVTVANSKTQNLKHLTLNSDVIISVTGKPDLIKTDMVKEGSVLIDVGSPKGDIERAAYEKASFVSPVPGGVGPVTISSLMENLVESSVKNTDAPSD